MILSLRELPEPLGDRSRLVELAEVDERLDELRRRGEGPPVVHALVLGVRPDPPQRLGREIGLA
jgi:hypothetical protein